MSSHQVTFSVYKHVYATESNPITASWGDWCESIEEYASTIYSKKTQLLSLSTGLIPKGLRRQQRNMESITGVCLDIERKATTLDKEEYERDFEKAMDNISHLNYALWSTFSSTEDEPRFRILIPLKDPIPPTKENNTKLMSYMNCLTWHICDAAAQKLSQPHFLPGRTEDAPPAMFYENEGGFLDFRSREVQEIIKIREVLGVGHGKAPTNIDIREPCMQVARGEAYADEGSRDETVLRIALQISRLKTELLDESIDKVFEQSHFKMGYTHSETPNIQSKINRAIDKYQEPTPEFKEGPDKSKEYIIQHGKSYWLFDCQKGEYSRAYTTDEIDVAFYKHFDKNPEVALERAGAKGMVEKARKQLVREYGSLVHEVRTDLSAKSSRLEDNVFIESTVPWPNIQPTYDPDIDEWLSLIGGKRYEDFKQWLAIFPDLNRTLSCLVVLGAPRTGKSLLAHGLASIFGADSPCDQDVLTGTWTGALCKMPFIYIDEEVSDKIGQRTFMAAIRSQVSTTSRPLKRRYLTDTSLEGAIRCVITANHLPFKSNNSSTAHDVEAVAERFFWCQTEKEVRDFLDSIPPDTKRYWGYQGIAKHVLHLQNTVTTRKDYRMGVSGDPKLADIINITTKWNSAVLEWVLNGVLDGFQKLSSDAKDQRHGCVISHGRVYVRVKTIIAAWDKYLDHSDGRAETRSVSNAVRALANGGAVKPAAISSAAGHALNNQTRYHEIRIEALETFIEHFGLFSKEALYDGLKRSTPLPKINGNVIDINA